MNFTTSSVTDDNQGHGTHVAGSAAAGTDNGVGVAGVGGNSGLVNAKVLDDSGSGAYSWITNGILWASGCDNNPCGPPRAAVINMSLGGTGSSLAMEDAVNKAWANGEVVVMTSGNSDSSGAHYSKGYEKVIPVAPPTRTTPRRAIPITAPRSTSPRWAPAFSRRREMALTG